MLPEIFLFPVIPVTKFPLLTGGKIAVLPHGGNQKLFSPAIFFLCTTYEGKGARIRKRKTSIHTVSLVKAEDSKI
jgi:hypothetical protein